MSTHVLVVEDDPATRLSIVAVLNRQGYIVTAADDGEAAIDLLEQTRSARRQPYDVVISDIRMRTVDGIEVLYAARSIPQPPAVIILTGFGSVDTSIAALRAGAYDYLIKPCDPPDLLEYVQGAVERRSQERRHDNAIRTLSQIIGDLKGDTSDSDSESGDASTPTDDTVGQPSGETSTDPVSPASEPQEPDRYIQVGRLCIDNYRHTASFADKPLHLTPMEYALLRCLAQAQGRVLEYREITRRTHGYIADRTEAHSLLKPHIHKLRRKIHPDYVVSVRGTGYMLAPPPE